MNQYGRIFVEFSVFRPAIENRGFKQIKNFLRRFTQHNMQIYLSEKKMGVRCTLSSYSGCQLLNNYHGIKCLNGLAPPYLCQKFKTRSEVHNCNTRNRDRLHIPLCRTAAGQRAFTFRGQRLWNSLPDEFQSITNLDLFKVKIKQHFLRVFLKN